MIDCPKSVQKLGNFRVRVHPQLHKKIAERSQAQGISMNQCVNDLLLQSS